MNLLGRLFQALRVWTGLADGSDSRLTPAFGWLLPAPAAARALREIADEQRRIRTGRA